MLSREPALSKNVSRIPHHHYSASWTTGWSEQKSWTTDFETGRMKCAWGIPLVLPSMRTEGLLKHGRVGPFPANTKFDLTLQWCRIGRGLWKEAWGEWKDGLSACRQLTCVLGRFQKFWGIQNATMATNQIWPFCGKEIKNSLRCSVLRARRQQRSTKGCRWTCLQSVLGTLSKRCLFANQLKTRYIMLQMKWNSIIKWD